MAIRAAVVGMGSYYSVNFARALRALGTARVELVGAAHLGVDDETLSRHTKLTRAGFGERFGVRTFERAEDLLAETRPQLVCVAAPDRDKPHYAAMAVDAGADVYLSKPMACSVEGASAIRAAARRH
ncbi:MAG TPA: Gfo/Idh/MocA family oxidoreductase, partial [Chloroflexota bacterium]|nr:Gfo/Idh/MocA family oxidoreductase [Chloroflexota bacterium]